MEKEGTTGNGRVGAKKNLIVVCAHNITKQAHATKRRTEGLLGPVRQSAKTTKVQNLNKVGKRNTNKSWKIVTPSKVYFSKRINT